VMQEEGPVFVLVKVFREAELPEYPERSMAAGWAEVRARLAPKDESQD